MRRSSRQYAVDEEGKYVLEFVPLGPTYWLEQISARFVLTNLEKTVLRSYLNRIDPESLASFSSKLSLPLSDLKTFIDRPEEVREMRSVAHEDILNDTESGMLSVSQEDPDDTDSGMHSVSHEDIEDIDDIEDIEDIDDADSGTGSLTTVQNSGETMFNTAYCLACWGLGALVGITSVSSFPM